MGIIVTSGKGRFTSSSEYSVYSLRQWYANRGPHYSEVGPTYRLWDRKRAVVRVDGLISKSVRSPSSTDTEASRDTLRTETAGLPGYFAESKGKAFVIRQREDLCATWVECIAHTSLVTCSTATHHGAGDDSQGPHLRMRY